MSSSSRDEIIEISSSPSSLDNDSSESSRATPEQNVPSISSLSSSSSVSQKRSLFKSNKRYQSKFKKEWLSNPRFSAFLRECKSDPAKALCCICNIQFSIQISGSGDINHHIETIKHKNRSKAVEANRCTIY